MNSESESENDILNESDEDAITLTELLEKINKSWQNEKSCLALLEPQSDVIDLIMDEVSNFEERILTNNDHISKQIQKLQVQRIKFVITDYLRVRWKKIEPYLIYYLNEDSSKLTTHEKTFAKEVWEAYTKSMNETLCKTKPNKNFKLENFVRKPDENIKLCCKVVDTVFLTLPKVTDDDTDLESFEFKNGVQFMAPYKYVKEAIASKKMDLI